MKFLPLEDITYKTKLSESEIINRLSESLEPKKPLSFSSLFNKTIKPYQGEIIKNEFKITRIINYRNSFLPIITGKIKSEFNGTTITVRMRLHIFVIVFLYFWCATVASVFIGFTSSIISSRNFDPFALIPFGMLIFIYALTMGGFKSEANKSKKYLKELFEAEILIPQK